MKVRLMVYKRRRRKEGGGPAALYEYRRHITAFKGAKRRCRPGYEHFLERWVFLYIYDYTHIVELNCKTRTDQGRP